MQIVINSDNIETFSVDVTVSIYDRTFLFDTSQTVYESGGAANVLGIAFSVVDEQGVELAAIDWDAPQIPDPATTDTWTLDLASTSYAFLFQTYKIIAAIKDADGTITYLTFPFEKVCQPVGFTSSGYVAGTFQIITDCVNNALTVKELTLLTYNGLQPSDTDKTGTLYYPTGTIDPISFTGTPFTNDVVYTGQMRIVDTTVATYDMGDGFYILVNYYTNNIFDITCSNKMSEVLCCIMETYTVYQTNCNNARGLNALEQYNKVAPYLVIGLMKEISGQDASEQVAEIKKILKCNCGVNSILQNEASPINPTVYSLIISGLGGTSVPSTTTVGNTKTYYVASNVYQVTKTTPSDLAFSITQDTSTEYLVKYKIGFNYTVLANTILTTIAGNNTLLNLFNSLVSGTANISLVGLDGSCVIDLTSANYALTRAITVDTTVVNIVINGTTYTAPANLLASDAVSFQSWLNSLTLGTFAVSTYTDGSLYVFVSSTANSNVVSTITLFTTSNVTYKFGTTTATLITVLQAMIDYMCDMSLLQVKLGTALNVCDLDYNGDTTTTTYSADTDANTWAAAISTSICNIISWMQDLTGVTCDKMKEIFQANAGGVMGSGDYFYGTMGGDCAGISRSQAALAIIAAINGDTTVKAAFCAIDCSVPAGCPDVANESLNAISTGSIGVYGVTWTSTPAATQVVTVRYRITGSLSWTTATNALNILPNGNLSGSSPYVISGLDAATTYDIWITNNCGGSGFIKQVLTQSDTVYSDDYLLDSNIYNICGNVAVTLYSNTPFAVGIILYTDIGLTTPVSGYDYVSPSTSGVIYELDSSTGEVGADTGLTCGSGIIGTYILGNDTGTICAGSTIELYTATAFGVGVILYEDSALSTPVTGYDYVVNTATNGIFNLDNATGEVGTDTGLSCSSNTVRITHSMGGVTVQNVTGITGFTASPPFPLSAGGTVVGIHSAFTGSINVQISGSPVISPSNITLYRNGTQLQCVPVTAFTGLYYTFGSQTYAASDVITISLGISGC